MPINPECSKDRISVLELRDVCHIFHHHASGTDSIWMLHVKMACMVCLRLGTAVMLRHWRISYSACKTGELHFRARVGAQTLPCRLHQSSKNQLAPVVAAFALRIRQNERCSLQDQKSRLPRLADGTQPISAPCLRHRSKVDLRKAESERATAKD